MSDNYQPMAAINAGFNNAQTALETSRKTAAFNALAEQYGPTAGDPERAAQLQTNDTNSQLDPVKVQAALLGLDEAKRAHMQDATLKAALALKAATQPVNGVAPDMGAAYDTVIAPNAELLGMTPEQTAQMRDHLMSNPQSLDAIINGLQGPAKPLTGADLKNYVNKDGTTFSGYTDERGAFHKLDLPDGAQPMSPLGGAVQTMQRPDGTWAYGRMNGVGQMVWTDANGTPVAGMNAAANLAKAGASVYNANVKGANSEYGAGGAAPPGMPGAIMKVESGGNPNAVSPKGAQGLMQLMPETAAHPGFGIAPAKDGSPAENLRVGSEYYAAMLKRYRGNTVNALAAYNWGPGNVDAWLKKGSPPSAMPAETKSYVGAVLAAARQGGGVQHLFSAPQQQAQAAAPFDSLPAKGKVDAIRAATGIVNSSQQLASIDGQIENIQKMVGPLSVGLGSLTAPVPGTPASNMHAALQTLKSQGLTSWLASLKNGSNSTGIGRVLQSEAAAAMNSFGALEQSQSEGQFRYHLDIFKQRVHQLQDNAETAFKTQYGVDPHAALGQPAPQQQAAAGPTTTAALRAKYGL